ncbi:MAG: hypothetical protein Q7J57_02955 [Gemmobacter sp.]|nr:hypothetical protein [Gemmobacter sp.]
MVLEKRFPASTGLDALGDVGLSPDTLNEVHISADVTLVRVCGPIRRVPALKVVFT